jgi:magnesium-transporting ATPase (P-type)
VLFSPHLVCDWLYTGLPLAVTISLAYSTKKMYQDQCFIRVLAACETMGNATNICSDKTGTLTENRMTIVEGWYANVFLTSNQFSPDSIPPVIKTLLAEHIAINRQAYLVLHDQAGRVLPRPSVIGNKTEGALLILLQAWGMDYQKVFKESFDDLRGDRIFAFNSTRKRSIAVVCRNDGSVCLFCKVKGINSFLFDHFLTLYTHLLPFSLLRCCIICRELQS